MSNSLPPAGRDFSGPDHFVGKLQADLKLDLSVPLQPTPILGSGPWLASILKNQASVIHDLIMDEHADLAYITIAWVEGMEVEVPLSCLSLSFPDPALTKT